MTDWASRLRSLSPVLVVGVLLVLAAGVNYLGGRYGGAVAAGVGAILACSFAVLTDG
jgi:lipopolysaccharide export LptBFGC system permease protein LptF